MHILGRPKIGSEKIPETLEEMENEKLIDLQHELQAAVKYHDHAQSYGDRAFAHEAATPWGASDKSTGEKVRHGNKFREIAQSDLYRSTVGELESRYEFEVDVERFVGWLDLEENHLEDINNALDTMARKDVSEKIKRISKPEKDEISCAEETLEKYGLNGYFVEADDLNREFTEHYTSGISTGGRW